MTPAQFYIKHAPVGSDGWSKAQRAVFAFDFDAMLRRWYDLGPDHDTHITELQVVKEQMQ